MDDDPRALAVGRAGLRPPETTARDDPTLVAEQGLYRRRFPTPAGAGQGRVFLVFDGVMTDTRASLNGRPVGPVHRGGFYRFKYEVTDLLRRDGGENVLEVVVDKRSADDSINKAERRADFWIFGGIFRPVWLEIVPPEFVERFAVDARANGSFRAEVGVNTERSRAADKLALDILDRDGKVVAGGGADVGATEVTAKLAGAKLWTAETPNLYTARLRLMDGDAVLHERSERFGFRTVEVRKGDGVYVNGRRVLMKGVDRHSFRPESGRALSVEQNRDDAATIKRMNMNAARMSHYPPDTAFLEAADEMGLYVIDELTGWSNAYSEEAGRPLVREMIDRDHNHPSILFWANGNEGGWNTKLDGDFAVWDAQDRPVLHPWSVFSEVDTKHYPTYDLLTERLAGENVLMPTEILHGLYDGGMGAGMRDYWDAMTASKVGAGFFLWVFADEGVVRTGDDGEAYIDVAGNQAPDGLLGPHHEREASADTVRKIWSPVLIDDALPEGFDGALRVRNAYDFTNLKQTRFTWELRRFHSPDEVTAGDDVVAKGSAESPDVGPGEAGELRLDLPTDRSRADALAVTATDADGLEVWTWVWPLREVQVWPSAETAAGGGTLRSGDVDACGPIPKTGANPLRHARQQDLPAHRRPRAGHWGRRPPPNAGRATSKSLSPRPRAA